MKKEFNQLEYIKEYQKKNKAQFRVDLNKEELEEANILLEEAGITKVQLVRDAIKQLKNKEIKGEIKMKFIKGSYEEKLRKYENIKNLVKHEKENIFYYLQDNENFTNSLYIYNELATQKEDEDDCDFEDRVKIHVCNLDQNHKYTNIELKNMCLDFIKNNNIKLD